MKKQKQKQVKQLPRVLVCDNAKDYEVMEWEGLCHNCGECCMMYDYRVDPPKKIGYCPQLRNADKFGKRYCGIYFHPQRRGIKLPDGNHCGYVEEADIRILPKTCGYYEIMLKKPKVIRHIDAVGIKK